MGLSVFFTVDRLVKKISLSEANIEAKQPQGVCKARRDALHSLLHVGDENSVVLESKVLDQSLLGLDWSILVTR